MFNVRNIVLITHDLMHIIVIVSFVSTQMLLHRRPTDNHRENQVVGRPFVVFICASHINRQRRTTLVNKDMYFAT